MSSSPFHVEVEVVDHGPGVWKTAIVRSSVTRQIGEYARNHAGWCRETFYPFQQNGRWYALYAPDYTATRVMELPSCRDLGGEEHHTHGFCPVDYYVPFEHPQVVKAGHAGSFGFVAGCIWGDDSSWKVQYLDLSGVERGVLLRKELFGYLPMLSKAALKDCVSLDEYAPPEFPIVTLAVELSFDLTSGKALNPWD